MTPETPPSPREALEIRITAMLLGELSAEESAALQKRIEGDLELADLAARLRQAMELLREASAIPEQPAPPVPAQLSSERREKLLAHFKAPAPAPSAVIVRPRREWKTFVRLGIAAALIGFIGLLPIQLWQAHVILSSSGVSDPRPYDPPPPLKWFVRTDRSEAPDFQSEGGGLVADATTNLVISQIREAETNGGAESRWASQPGAIRTDRGRVGRTALWTDDEASRVNIDTASEGTFWDKSARDSGGARGETAKPLADVSLASAGDRVAANKVELDVNRAAQPEGFTDTPRFAKAAPALGVPVQMFGRSGGTSSLASTLGTTATPPSPAEPAAPPARMPIYLGTQSENAAAENAPAPRPAVAAATAPAPLAGLMFDSISEMKSAEPAPAADAFGNVAINGEVSGTLSTEGKVDLPQAVVTVRRSASVPENWERGLSKHMNGALGDKMDAGNVTFAYDSAPVTATGTVRLPELPGLSPAAESKPAAHDAAKPADSKRGNAVQWMDSETDGSANISRDKAAAPVSGPAPAESALPQVLAQSTSMGGSYNGSDAAKELEERTKFSISDPNANRLNHSSSDFNAPTLADGRAISKMTSGGAGGGSALGLDRLSRVEGEKGKATFNKTLGYTSPDGSVVALGDAQKKLALTDLADSETLGRKIVPGADAPARGGAMGGGAAGNNAGSGRQGIQRRNVTSFQAGDREEFGVAATDDVVRLGKSFASYSIDAEVPKGKDSVVEFEGFIAADGTSDSRRAAELKPQGGRSQDWSGQVSPTAKNPPEDLVTKLTAAGVSNGGKPNVELAFGTKTDDFTDAAESRMEAGHKLAIAPAKKSGVENAEKDVKAVAAVRSKSKAAPPAKPASVAKESKVETRKLYESVDELVFDDKKPVAQTARKLDDQERLSLNAVDFVEQSAPAKEESLKEVREMESVTTGAEAVDGRELARQTVSESRVRAPITTGKKALPETLNKAKNDPSKRELATRTDAASDKGFDQLRDEVEKQRKRADEAAVEVAKIRDRDGIVDPNPNDYGTMIGAYDRNIVAVESQLNETRADVTKLRDQMAEFEKLKPGDLKKALTRFGMEDPEIEKIQGTDASSRLAEKLDTIRATLGVRLRFQEGVVRNLETQVELAKSSPIADRQKEKANDYIEAKTRFLQAKRIHAAAAELLEKQNPVELDKLEKSKKQIAQKDSDEKPATAKPAEPAPVPQPEIATSANAFSTFSLNVADVSFKLAAASLEKGQMPEVATVRSEEFINAFDYRDPEPAASAPLAFAAERARYPFAQNRDLLRLSVKTAAAGRQPGRALNLVLLLDNSGSMERADRVRILHESLRVLTTQLQPQDKLSVVTFARTPQLWADGVAGDKAAEVTARVGEITPQGGTNLSAALDLGYATARKHFQPGSINRVVLLTDGAANLGDVNPDALKQKVEAHRKQGIALDCFGIGWEGYDDTVLEALSRNGDGRYGFINSPEEAATEFAGQLAGALRVAASDVKVQVEWNPRRVTAYRQIGYAKHQLKKEQFRDNTVDAAEIGAAESGNALYVCEVNPRGEGDLATVRVRFKVPGTSDYKEHEWTVPYTKDAPPLEQASPALRLAGTASAFSEWLVASQYASEVTPDRLLGLLNGVPATFGADPRPRKLEWMIRTAKSVSGR